MYRINRGEIMSNQSKGINTFQRYLSVWVLLCMAIGVLLTLVIIFSSQAEVILSNPLHIVLIAVPLTIQTFFSCLCE